MIDGPQIISYFFPKYIVNNVIACFSNIESTVGPRLSGHQLAGYLYYPAAILRYILSIFTSNLAQNKNKLLKFLGVLHCLDPFYINDNLLQTQ